MTPWDAVANLIVGLWKSHQAEKWVRAWMSLILSALLTFLFSWGTAIGSLYHAVGAIGALVLGFGLALVATAGAILGIVRRVEQFKNVALFFPAKIEGAINQIATTGGTEFDPNKKQ
jgi:hypothetical protein